MRVAFRSRVRLAIAASAVISASRAATVRGQAYVSATGTFTDANNPAANFYFHVPATSNALTAQTFAYGGGTNAAGQSIPVGGSPTYLQLYTAADVFVAQNTNINDNSQSHDALLSPTGQGTSFLPPQPMGGYRLRLAGGPLSIGDGAWAGDLVNSTGNLVLTNLTNTPDCTLTSLAFGGLGSGSVLTSVQWTAGTLTVDAGTLACYSNSTLTLSGGTIAARYELVGGRATAPGTVGGIVQSNSVNSVGDRLLIGNDATVGVYTLNYGTLALESNGFEEVVGNSSDGVLYQNGGTNDCRGASANLLIGSASPAAGGTYVLTDGMLLTNQIVLGKYHDASVSQSGGSVTATDLLLSPGSGIAAEYAMTGGTLALTNASIAAFNSSATLSIANGAVVSVSGTCSIDGSARVEVTNGGRLTALHATNYAWITIDGSTADFGGGITNYGTISLVNGTLIGPVLGSGSASLEAHGASALAAGASVASKVGILLIFNSTGGSLDVNDNDLIVTLDAFSQIHDWVVSGRNGGSWDGPGLRSNAAATLHQHATALAAVTGADYRLANGRSTFSGQTYADSDSLVKYTWNGDANLDGRVNFDDYVRTDIGFNTHLGGWVNGDFDYSGSVNFDDYVLIDIAFNVQSGTLSRAVDYLSGDDRSAAGLSDPGVRMVIEHLDEFGFVYAQAFLVAVPEPTVINWGAVIPVLTAISSRRRQRVPGVR